MTSIHHRYLQSRKGFTQKQLEAYERATDFAFAVAGGRANDSEYWCSRIKKRASLHSSNQKKASSPHTCQHCQKLVIDPGQSGDPWDALDDRSSMKKIVFDCSINEIEEGSVDGCPLMAQLWAETKTPTEEEQSKDTYRLVADIAMRGSRNSFEFTSLSRLRLQNLEYPWKTPRKEFDSHDGGFRLAESLFHVHAEPGDRGAYIIRDRPVSTSPAEDIFMQKVKHNLERSISVQQADSGDLTQSVAAPTRLIRVAKLNENWSLRLEKVTDPSVQYCTLSYCWGLAPSGLTTGANLHQRYKGLDFHELPKTIQDAVTVVEKLGFNYLWVDAICIIQESDDKAREITKMASIYGNSVLTICASRALTAEEGFLHPRIHFEPEVESYKLPFKLPENQGIGNVILGMPLASLGENRLQGRAWAFQERIMARRILDFDDEATSLRWWEPDGEIYIQDGGSLHHACRWSSTDMFRERDFNLLQKSSKICEINGVYLMRDWSDRINEYTSLDITLQTDRILAIASVAEKVAKLTNGTYLAGLWLKHLPWSLMWSMSDRKIRVPRPSSFQGPSWSWSAINGQIHGWFPQRLCEEGAKVECDIIGWEIDPVYANALYGSVRSASLVLQAKARRARWVRSDKVKRGGDYDYLAYLPQHRSLWSHSHSQDAHVISKVTQMSQSGTKQTYTPQDLLPARMYPDALEREFATPVAEGGQTYLDVILLQLLRHKGDSIGLVIREPEDGVCQRLGIFTSRKGQNYSYATDDRDHEIHETQDRENPRGHKEEAPDANVPLNLMAEVKQLGLAWEKQIEDEIGEQRQEQQEEVDWERFFAWFDENDCQEQTFVLI